MNEFYSTEFQKFYHHFTAFFNRGLQDDYFFVEYIHLTLTTINHEASSLKNWFSRYIAKFIIN